MKQCCLVYLRPAVSRYSRAFRARARLNQLSTCSSQPLPDPSGTHDLFNYTSGRWVYNEQKRFAERRRVFNVLELQRLAAEAVGRKLEDVLSINKLGEGAANRAFVIQLHDRFKLVARIPYLATEPRQQLVASEAAPMTFLRAKGIPVPEIYGYSAIADNAAQTEYIFMEFGPGRNLGSLWADMNEQNRVRFRESLFPSGLAYDSEESRSEQRVVPEKRQFNDLYMEETSRLNPTHYSALTYPFSVGGRKIYDLASGPWQGDNVPLRSSLVFIKKHWQQIAANPDIPCPIAFSAEEEQECLRLDELEREAAEQLRGSMEMLGLGPEGWVSNNNYKAAKKATARMKEICLEQAETEMERIAVRDHWVYDDMDEDEYL